ncbi:MAG: TetR/AcrR family transcriptional regulator [Acidobacteria bacterium]|nr:TetR/AcrR family transcriptional regulator [Acidobacteriota bacterium]
MGRPRKSDREAAGDPRELILTSARAEVEKNGILGLRVAEVAANAHYSVSIIYRYFGDRDGLLAQVLGDLYEEILDRTAQRMTMLLPASGPLTVDQILGLAPKPSEAYTNPDLKLRLQILAVAATNPTLEARLKDIAQARFKVMKDWSASVVARLPEGQVFDERVLFILIVNQLLYYNTLLGDEAVTDEEYFRFLRDKTTKI